MCYKVLLVLVFSAVSAATAATPYVYTGNPYLDGVLPTNYFYLTKDKDRSPIHCIVFHPTKPGNYGVFYFIGGMDGMVIAESYINYLQRIAAHGFIAIGADAEFPLLTKNRQNGSLTKDDIPEKYNTQFLWLRKNFDPIMSFESPGVVANFNYTAIGSHSAGAAGVLRVLEDNHHLFKSVVFYEPFSLTFSKPNNFSLTALIVGTIMSEQHRPKFPPCIIPGFGYNHFWDLWQHSSKFFLLVKNFGHCDINDFVVRVACDKLDLCLTGNETNMDLYQTFTMGVTSGFLVYTLYGVAPNERYIIDTSTMPIAMDSAKHIIL